MSTVNVIFAFLAFSPIHSPYSLPPMEATGTFSVAMTPMEDSITHGVAFGRLRVEKTFTGDLEGTSTGTMLTAITPVEGSAGYVLQEQFVGSVHGRQGSFVLQHSGLMDQGAPTLAITIVPGSGTDQLQGIRGELLLDLSGGTYSSYTLSYLLAD